ncbi:hypothetical protein GOP47_0006526 [Adiantum capillus-veneris]|uniref:ABC transporter B family member 20 n=1 Tax=Adiantum capillus-veneris TaxID=13818 RepID=A0A9D4V316_ADICA|nr:hypothetical protein GOP47_0006526 [Adiantum capillus-veneris]
MMLPRGLFGWSPPHVQPLTPVSEVSEPPESPSPYLDVGADAIPVDDDGLPEEMEEAEPPPAAVPFFRLFAYATPFDWFLMSIAAVAAAAHGAALPIYLHFFGKIINMFGSENLSSSELFHEFTQHCLSILYVAASALVAGWIEVSCWIYTGERQTAQIRSSYVRVLFNQDMGFFDTYGNNGDIVSQVLNDVVLIQFTLSEKVGNYIHNMATFLGGLAIGFVSCWQVALVTLGTGPFIVAAGGISNIFLHKLAEDIQDAYAEAATIAEQAIAYIRTLYAFANETLAKYSYANALQATLRYGVQISLVQGLGLGFTYGLAICSCALQLWFGRYLVAKGLTDGGAIVTALFAIILSGLGLNQAATNFYAFEQGRIAAHRLFDMISRSSFGTTEDGKALINVQGNLEFRNVYFSYPSRPDIPILSGFFLEIPARKTVALVGRHGSGKSSIIPLIERFYDPTLGEVLLDGENIKNLRVEWLRSQIGLVSQEPALFTASIKENILYGRSASMDEVEEAAKIAHAHTFISSLSEAYDTQVGGNALGLSEDQKLKIAIARAVLKNPCILLLDEVTGALDVEAERVVQEALDLLMLGRSTVVIARRLSVVRSADMIAVVEEGRLAELGSHEELLAANGLYTDLIRHEEAAKPPKRVLAKPYRELTASQSLKEQPVAPLLREAPITSVPHESQSIQLVKSPSLQRQHGTHALLSFEYNSAQESPKLQSPPTEQKLDANKSFDVQEKVTFTNKRQDSFEICLPSLPKLDVHAMQQRISSSHSDPESPVSPLLTSDPKNERSHSKTFSRVNIHYIDVRPEASNLDLAKTISHKPPSLWRLAKLSSPEWLYAILGSLGAALFGSFNPLLAFVLVQVVQNYYEVDSNGGHAKREINKWCLVVVGMGVVTVVANFLQHFYFGIMGEKMTERVRRMMFSAILRNEVGWFDEEENSTDALNMRLANDATFVRAAFSNRLSILIQDLTAMFVALAVGIALQWRVALVALASVPFLVISAVAQKLWLEGFAGDIQEVHKSSCLVLENAVRNIYTVVAFSAEKRIMEVYSSHLSKILMRSFMNGQVRGLAFGVSQFLLFACNALLLWYAALVVRRSEADLPTVLKQFIIFSFATFALVEPFGLAPYILKRRKSLVSVFGIIDRKPTIDSDDSLGLRLPNVYGTIELRNVDFRYPSRPEQMVLNSFSLKVTGGQTVAIVGASGSGKSTVIALIERFYDPVSGQVMLDGKDIKTLNLRWLRNHMGLVQQEPVLFSTSIRENIIYARHNATEAEMKEAARIANAHHFISNLPHGYDTHVGMRGLELTSGQKQRIAIARVVLKNAPILLLDEASTAIESESSRVVQEALETLIMGNKTTILIAHRLAMMRHVDMIVVLNEGHIVEEGSHDALIAKNGLYARLMQPHFKPNLRQQRIA